MRLFRTAGSRWPSPDFLPQVPRVPTLAWVWLGCGALVLALAADEWLAVDAARDELHRQTDRLQAAARPAKPPPAAPDVRPEAARAAQTLVRRLDHPWQSLFEGTERLAAGEVRWLRMEHDAERGEVRLEAAAPSRDAVLKTLDALAAAPRWSEVMLLRVEAAGVASGLRFELRARHGPEAAAVAAAQAR